MSTALPHRRPHSRVAEWLVLSAAALALLGCAWHARSQGDDALRLGTWWMYAGGVSVALGFVFTLFPRSRNGVAATVALAGFGVGMAGQHDAPRWPFAVACLAYALCAQYALRRADPTRPAPRVAVDTKRRAVLAVAAGSVLLCGALIAALPPVHHGIVRYATQSMYRGMERAGLSDQLELGALDGLARSDRIVLRVEGNEPHSLRGVVYDWYFHGQWRSTRARQDRPASVDAAASEVPSPAPPTRGSFVVQRVRGPWRAYYVSLEQVAPALAQESRLRTNAYGVLLPPLGEISDRLALDFGPHAPAISPAVRAHAAPAAPGAQDLFVPEFLREQLAALATEWRGEAREPAAVMAALERRLARANRYSLEVPAPPPNTDPVIAFLFGHRRGHCEYFASALALLGRSVGVPTRVVAGYRGGDWNSVGGYFVVRDRHAHSWVEAFVPERGWRTYDATPPSGDAPMVSRPMPWASAAWDALFNRLGKSWQWLRARPATDAIYVALVLAVAFGLSRLRRVRKKRDDEGTHDAARPLANEPTPDSYRALCGALEACGVTRAPAETLERYAARVEEEPSLRAREGDQTGPRAAAALRSYASLRYGSEGDAVTVERALEASAAELVARAPNGVRAAAPR